MKIVPSHVGTDTVVENICNYTCKIDDNFVENMTLLQFSLKLVCKLMKDI